MEQTLTAFAVGIILAAIIGTGILLLDATYTPPTREALLAGKAGITTTSSLPCITEPLYCHGQ